MNSYNQVTNNKDQEGCFTNQQSLSFDSVKPPNHDYIDIARIERSIQSKKKNKNSQKTAETIAKEGGDRSKSHENREIQGNNINSSGG